METLTQPHHILERFESDAGFSRKMVGDCVKMAVWLPVTLHCHWGYKRSRAGFWKRIFTEGYWCAGTLTPFCKRARCFMPSLRSREKGSSKGWNWALDGLLKIKTDLPGQLWQKRGWLALTAKSLSEELHSCQSLAVSSFIMFTSILNVRWCLIFILICMSLITNEPKHLIKCLLIFWYFSFALLIHTLGWFSTGAIFLELISISFG